MEYFYLTFDCFYFHQLRQFRRASKAHAHHMSEEEKKKRKKSLKKVKAGPNLSRTSLLAASLSIAGAFLWDPRRKEIIFLSFSLLASLSHFLHKRLLRLTCYPFVPQGSRPPE